MRHESERIPGKNYRPFAGEPLYRHIIRTLLACPHVDQVVIDTDSLWITEDTAAHFPSVRVVTRPDNLRAGTVPMHEVLLNTVGEVPAEFYLQTHSTNPLLSSETISRAIDRFMESWPTHDSLFSATPLRARLWDGLTRAVNHNPAILLRTQDLPPVFVENSCLYLFPRNVLISRRNRIGERPLLYEMEPHEAWDIDDELDFRVGEYLFAHCNST